jgi:hypothetical protein
MRNHMAIVIVTNGGSEADALNSLSSIATCKPKGSPRVKPPRPLLCPVPHCKRGALGRIGSMPALMWSSSLRAFPVLPSSIAWCWRDMWSWSKSGRVACGWSVSCCR